ncbi:uncharacterized protein LOC143277609 isoform X2 [Babylonia areolata]|uniref:uncharacterized protein LOC143277609 isoform X2 n=1 Tax=Babylonia areolata TaxID=304850 RepID=UPI003FD2B94E
MAAIVRVVLVLLICWIRQCDAQDGPPSRISVSPTVIRLTPNTTDSGTKVTVTCEPPVSGVSTLLTLSISRWSFTSDSSSAVVLLSAVAGENNGNAKLLSNANLRGAEASGSVVGRSVTLTMNQAGCGDEAIYSCTAVYLDTQTKPLTSKNQAELKVEVSPGQLEMTASPPDVTLWAVNQILTLTCTGPVGSVNTTGGTNDPVVTWVWQYRRLGMGWSTYDGPQSDITTGGFTSKACLKEQTSSLRRRLALNDTGREYQCFVRRNGQGYERFAASHYVGTVTPDGTSPDNSEPSASSTADAGAIAGGVIGALILIAIIVIIVYFMVIRPRRQKQEEEYVDDVLEKGGDVDAVPPPYTADSAVVYSQPTRRSNKDKRWDDRDRGREEEERRRDTSQGLHYADLDLVRNPPQNASQEHAPAPAPAQAQAQAPSTPSTPTEYASIRLF